MKAVKYHTIAGLATVDKSCPIQLWDKFLPQIECTLNMLRSSQTNPKLSAYEDLFGTFDYNKTPMVPLGTKALAYVDPDVRGSWAPHALDTFYVGMSPLHYRLLEFWCPETRAYLITGSYKLFPTHCTVPTISEGDRTIISAYDILDAMKAAKPDTARSRVEYARVLERLSKIVQQGRAKAAANDHGKPPPSVPAATAASNDTISAATARPSTSHATQQAHIRADQHHCGYQRQ